MGEGAGTVMVEDNDADGTGFHPVVKLILARMESHPEEFTEGSWWKSQIELYKAYISPTDMEAYREKLRLLFLDRFHR